MNECIYLLYKHSIWKYIKLIIRILECRSLKHCWFFLFYEEKKENPSANEKFHPCGKHNKSHKISNIHPYYKYFSLNSISYTEWNWYGMGNSTDFLDSITPMSGNSSPPSVRLTTDGEHSKTVPKSDSRAR